jgi:hypothetical protein
LAASQNSTRTLLGVEKRATTDMPSRFGSPVMIERIAFTSPVQELVAAKAD